VELNHGPLLTGGVELPRLFPGQLAHRQLAGALIVDVRTDYQFAEAHVPGAVSIPLHRGGFGTKLAWIAAGADEIIFVGRDDEDGRRAGMLAAAVGLGHSAQRGGLLAGGMTSWTAEERELAELERVAVDALQARLSADPVTQILDVRERTEWVAGHIPGSVSVAWHDIAGIPAGIDAGQPIAVICASGQRAGVAASLLQRCGASQVIHVIDGGVPKWGALGGETVAGQAVGTFDLLLNQLK
jgi:hydroxyacylglutathione hydrolase